MEKTYVGRQLNDSVTVSDLLNGQSVATIQIPYLLTEADFLRIKGGQPITSASAAMLLSGVVGYAISLGPKISPVFGGGKLQLEAGESKTIIAGIIIAIVLYVIGFFCPNDKTRTLQKIEKHFDKAQPSSHIVGGV
ncbi:hypothetical protein [Pelotalea chapellei]|uniref:Uncharacterized protein n=1 Tax=Pelotalea chapellei TaxID=44671 RepID=A0ABS5UAE4_9BACT|nr:hypothetical protein [Pelotalea chapellei]MBT1072656.1 hypothetical protein [Pelotalea chapellei]